MTLRVGGVPIIFVHACPGVVIYIPKLHPLKQHFMFHFLIFKCHCFADRWIQKYPQVGEFTDIHYFAKKWEGPLPSPLATPLCVNTQELTHSKTVPLYCIHNTSTRLTCMSVSTQRCTMGQTTDHAADSIQHGKHSLGSGLQSVWQSP